MNDAEKLQTLRDHQAWRLGADSAPLLVGDITEAIDYAIGCVEAVHRIEAALAERERDEGDTDDDWWFIKLNDIRTLMVPK